MKYHSERAEQLIKSKWELESFEDVKIWDSQSRDEIAAIESYISQLSETRGDLEGKKIDIESKVKAKPFFLKPLTIGSGLNKTINTINKLNEEIKRVQNIAIELQGWMDATPDNQKETNEIITELKLAKKQIDINKKELQLQIKQFSIDTKQKIKKIESRVFFTSPKLKKLQINKAEKKLDKSTNPLEQDLLQLEGQELEVDKMILWYEKIKYS